MFKELCEKYGNAQRNRAKSWETQIAEIERTWRRTAQTLGFRAMGG